MKNYYILIVLISFLHSFFQSCTNPEIVKQENYVDTLISGNKIPPYDGVSSLMVENYINRLYIDLIGQEPSENTLKLTAQKLQTAGLSDTSINLILDSLMDSRLYFNRAYVQQKANLLRGVDSSFLAENIVILDTLIQIAILDSQYIEADYLKFEVARLRSLVNASDDYMNKIITHEIFIASMIDNPVYDEINMGSENFVVACYENLYYRQPTMEELEKAVNMVDGMQSSIQFQEGSTKSDFIYIFTHSDAFYEGQVVFLFKSLMMRDPKTQEMTAYVQDFKSGLSFQDIQRKVMLLREYKKF